MGFGPTCFLVDSSTMAIRWDTFLERVSRLVAPEPAAGRTKKSCYSSRRRLWFLQLL
jgi:hypothetical protein